MALGGLLTLRWRRFSWVHVPAALWGVLLELRGRICPLTPLEIRLRRAGGDAGYDGGFVEHYLLPMIYPSELTREIQVGWGSVWSSSTFWSTRSWGGRARDRARSESARRP